jgi:hypothetical protein
MRSIAAALYISTRSIATSLNISRRSNTTAIHITLYYATVGAVSLPMGTSVSTQTGLTLSSSSPRKQALRRQPRRERETSGEEEDGDVAKFCVLCDKLLPQDLATIVKMQLTLNKNAPTFRRYSREYKQFAITLFFLSPMAYRFLRTTFLLPTVRTLQRMTEKIRINPGLSRVVFDILKIKANSLGDEGKDCVLCADEMSIKGHLFYDIGVDELVGFQQLGASKDYLPANNVLAIMAGDKFEIFIIDTFLSYCYQYYRFIKKIYWNNKNYVN